MKSTAVFSRSSAEHTHRELNPCAYTELWVMKDGSLDYIVIIMKGFLLNHHIRAE